MHDTRRIAVSKYISRHLRHRPERLGLTLAPGGWVAVADLLAALRSAAYPVTLAELEEVVAHCPKQRFAFDASGDQIRANQGHSVEVDLLLTAQTPPAQLYHGTARPALAQIMAEGLLPMRRHHVHLSADPATARAVGARHGAPVVLRVDTAAMASAAIPFYCSANNVWLVDSVPPAFLAEESLGSVL